ncbi:hypothetical protein X742_26405 [Mesorhizobium sp. LNHC232B00]|nr:hypothetical protein X742_26405 [Mesorhizobium sp. LNHC232B00]
MQSCSDRRGSQLHEGQMVPDTGFGLLSGQHKSLDTIEYAMNWVGRYTFPGPAPR